MYGVVPKSLWQKFNPADKDNLCTWALRCLLVETADRLVLIDNGMGYKQSDKFFSYYHPHGEDTLEKSFAKHGFDKEDVTDVILTHLHFDHCGGSVQWNRDRSGYETSFKNALYWTTKGQWDLALNPNPREKASFLRENLLPIQESGRLRFLDYHNDYAADALPGISIQIVHGHTEAMILPIVRHPSATLMYMADLLPSVSHIPLPWIMSYDVNPLITLKEKETLLARAMQEEWVLFFEHDPLIACCTLQQTEKGIRVKNTGGLADFISP